jgi:nucleoside diphosphate kinase
MSAKKVDVAKVFEDLKEVESDPKEIGKNLEDLDQTELPTDEFKNKQWTPEEMVQIHIAKLKLKYENADTAEEKEKLGEELQKRIDTMQEVLAKATEVVNESKLTLFKDTFAMIKPGAVKVGLADAILAKTRNAGFTVVRQEKITLTKAQAKEFYAEHKGKEFYDRLVEFMSSGPILALHLRKINAIKEWRELCGPTNCDVARVKAPESLRALFGKQGPENAVHGSDSIEAVKREMKLVFGEDALKSTD